MKGWDSRSVSLLSKGSKFKRTFVVGVCASLREVDVLMIWDGARKTSTHYSSYFH